MRILHLFANYKWTGPADPAIRCARHLREAGADVTFAIAGWTLPDAEHRMAIELRRSRMPVIAGLELRKHFHPASHLKDARALRRRLDAGEYDVVHAHMLADHLIAAIAKRRAAHRPVLVRSLYDPDAPSRRSWRDRVALRYTDGVVAPTERVATQMRERFPAFGDRVYAQDPPVDLPSSRDTATLRELFAASDDDFLIGITARIQPHRKFDVLWQALRIAVDARPCIKVVLLGRGNEADTESLVREPVERLGLRDHAVLPGYLYEPDYSRALRGLDAFTFMVPGSDGTCRAVREAMAFGLPIVATRLGMLPEMLGPAAPGGPDCGIVCDPDPEALAAAWIKLVDRPEWRGELGAAARDRVRTSMNPVAATSRLLVFYERLRHGSSR